MQARYERQVQLSAPLQPGSAFEAHTHNGTITITGADVTDCNLTAVIVARAVTEEDAQKLAEEVKIKLQSFGSKLTAQIVKPHSMMNRSVAVNLNVTVPNHTDTELTTHNGAVTITNITGSLSATTHNGRVTAENTSGTAKLQTHNGKIICQQVSGDMQLGTHNGNINAVCSKDADPVCDVSMVTHNGSVDFTAPPSLSAKVQISTHNGSINTRLPITVMGKITRRELTGSIGAGQGKLHLETHNGSINLR
jgi:DUF4097 and DUF4098 domain-containing protein YvlB